MAISKKNLFLTISIIIVLFAIIISPSVYIGVALSAVDVWAKILLPSLFPFFVFTKLLTSIGYLQSASKVFAKPVYKMYRCPPVCSYIFLMSIITGYPVGSKIVSDMYDSGYLTKYQAKRCLTFTSNSGPMFIIGSVGIGMLFSLNCAYVLYLSHILGAIFNGLLYKKIGSKSQEINNNLSYKNTNQKINFQDSVMNSIFSIFLIGGIIVISFILIQVLIEFNVFSPIVFIAEKIGISAQISQSILSGILEMTKGCLSTSSLSSISLYTRTLICCGLITFGGLSTTLQAMAFLSKITSYKFFVLQKITHTIFAVIICAILGLFFI